MTHTEPAKRMESNPYRGELYARGYILTTSPKPIVPDGWVGGRIGDFQVRHDPRLRETLLDKGGATLLCLGLLHDVRWPERTTEECCRLLLDALLSSEDRFLEELAYTAGRYVLTWSIREELWLVTDATGMKPAFYYNQEARIVSSHVNLIRQNGRHARPAEPIALKFGYPGLRTPVTGSYLLTPNSKLDLRTLSPVRFWPRQAVPALRLEDAVQTAGAYLKGAFDHYKRFFTPIISVTAGLDSRLTMALSRGIGEAKFFTYYRADEVDSDELDRAFAQEFSRISGRTVDVIELRQTERAPEEFLAIHAENTIFAHIKQLAWVYYERMRPIENAIHVRSNISEVGREFWNGKKFPVTKCRDLARVYLYGDKEYKANYIFDVIDRFEEFDAITGLTGCRDLVDVKSLFYWEFRMASWHAGVVAESDPAFDTVSVYNCRKTLETVLSVEQKARHEGLILRNVIAQQWPELTQFDVNGKPFWPKGARPVELAG